jgi:hypothetical protein
VLLHRHGLIKISMHEHDTLVGFTQQSGAKFETGSRIDKAWPRPPEFHPGWTRGPTVVVPRTSLGARNLLSEDLSTAIAWIPAPQNGEVVEFTVVVETPGGAPDGAFMQLGDVALGSVVDRRSGSDVWVIAARRPTSDDFQLRCEHLLADPSNKVEVQHPRPDRSPGTFLDIYRDDLQPLVVDLPAPYG